MQWIALYFANVDRFLILSFTNTNLFIAALLTHGQHQMRGMLPGERP